MDYDSSERQDSLMKKGATLKDELRRTSEAIVDVDRQIRDLAGRLDAHKALVDDKNAEIQKYKKQLADLGEENTRLARSKRSIEVDLDATKGAHKAAATEADGLADENELLANGKALAEQRLKEAELDVIRLSRKLDEVQLELNEVDKQRLQREKELDIATETKRLNQTEAETLSLRNSRLQDERAGLVQKAKDLELQLNMTNRKINDLLLLIDNKDKELRSIRAGASVAEEREYTTREDLKKLKNENDILQMLLDKYRGDVDKEKKLRDEETMKKYQLEDEKKKLAREALFKDIEARSAKKELEKVQDSRERLLDEKLQVAQELDAIKQHADLLETQNDTVRNVL